MILDAGEVVEELRTYLSMRHPSVQWQVSFEATSSTLEPIIHIAARRHPFQPMESLVQCSFPLWQSMDPRTGRIEATVWSDWALKTLALLQHA